MPRNLLPAFTCWQRGCLYLARLARPVKASFLTARRVPTTRYSENNQNTGSQLRAVRSELSYRQFSVGSKGRYSDCSFMELEMICCLSWSMDMAGEKSIVEEPAWLPRRSGRRGECWQSRGGIGNSLSRRWDTVVSKRLLTVRRPSSSGRHMKNDFVARMLCYISIPLP